MKNLHEAHLYSVYFAPRGRERLLAIGEQISQRHLSFRDKLIGIVGDAGSGKSLIIKGMFPGVALSNDDDRIDPFKIMQVKDMLDVDFSASAYHLDMRFQMAFTQMYEIINFVKSALKHNRRVIIEHFDLLYPALNINADLIVGIGEEIIVTKPSIFGPHPKDIYDVVFSSIKNRRMAHTAEDLTTLILTNNYEMPFKVQNSDVRGGFVLNFDEKPDINLDELEAKVLKMIDDGIEVSYYDEEHIKLGDEVIMKCTGPRIHMRNTSDIIHYRLLKEIKYDYQSDVYAVVGLVGERDRNENDLNKIMREVY